MKLVECTNALGVDFMYDRMTELGVPYPGVKFRCSPEFFTVLKRLGSYLRECGLICDYVLTGGCYVNKPGEHGKGNAVDFDGYILGDYTMLYKDGIEYVSMSRKLARRIECAISLYAGVVLTEHYNSRHEDHIHFDIGQPVKWRGSRSQVLVVQAALNYWHDGGLDIDGKIGDRTLLAFNEYSAGVPMSTDIPNKKQPITNDRWRTFLDKVARGGA